MVTIHKAIDKYFKISESGSSIKTEILSGITAYFTMVYLLFLVPTTLMNAFPEAFDETGEMIGTYILSNGISANQMLVSLTVASCIAAAIGTLIMSFKANLPFVQGPSLAISTFISFTLCSKMGYTYNEALAAVFIGGIVFLIITIMGMEKKIQDSIPTNIKFAVTAGIGLFIAFMGMQKAHIVVPNSRNLVTLVDFADLTSYNTKSALLCLVGIIFISLLLIWHVHGAILIGKIVCILAAIPMGLVHISNFNLMDYAITLEPIMFKMDFAGLFTPHNSWGLPGVLLSVGVVISTLCIMDVVVTMGTIIATDYIITYSHNGSVSEKLPKVLKSDAIATSIGSCLGITNISTYVESTAMAIEGGRTGFSGVIAAILFALTIFVAPYASVVPSAATATTLIVSGVLMINVIKYVNFDDIEEAVPAFLTIALMPLTYSLVTGISIGLISYTFIMFFSKRRHEIKMGTIILAVIFLIQFILMQK